MEKTLNFLVDRQASSPLSSLPLQPLGFSLCVSLLLCLLMKVIDLGLYDLFIDTKTALRSGEKERVNQPSTHHNTLSSVLHFLSLSLPPPPTSCFFYFFFFFQLSPSLSCGRPRTSPLLLSQCNQSHCWTLLTTGPPGALIGQLAVDQWQCSKKKTWRRSPPPRQDDLGYVWTLQQPVVTWTHIQTAVVGANSTTVTDINEQLLPDCYQMVLPALQRVCVCVCACVCLCVCVRVRVFSIPQGTTFQHTALKK